MKLTTEKAIEWFDELANRAFGRTPVSHRTIHRENVYGERRPAGTYQVGGDISTESAVRWISDAELAIKSVFPVGHPMIAVWEAVLQPVRDGKAFYADDRIVDAARGAFETARAALKSGRLASISDGVRAETVVEVLDQAEQLVHEKASLPAAVLAGGALETHLRHLCDRAGLLGGLTGHGAIDKYKGLLDQARKAGNEVISKGDGKLVTAWADDRNTAAHEPTEFKKGAAEVQLVIDGIRQFIARTES